MTRCAGCLKRVPHPEVHVCPAAHDAPIANAGDTARSARLYRQRRAEQTVTPKAPRRGGGRPARFPDSLLAVAVDLKATGLTWPEVADRIDRPGQGGPLRMAASWYARKGARV